MPAVRAAYTREYRPVRRDLYPHKAPERGRGSIELDLPPTDCFRLAGSHLVGRQDIIAIVFLRGEYLAGLTIDIYPAHLFVVNDVE